MEGSWMIGLTTVEVYISIYNKTEENNKLELCTDPLDREFSITELNDKVLEVHGLSDISIEVLKYEICGLNIIETYRKLSKEESQTVVYFILILAYNQSSFRDIETYFRILSPLDENDIQLTLKQHNSIFFSHMNFLQAFNEL